MSVIDRIYQFLEYKFLSDKQLDQLNLSKYVGVSKESFNEKMNVIIEAKKDGLKTNVDGGEITLDNAESLVKAQVVET